MEGLDELNFLQRASERDQFRREDAGHIWGGGGGSGEVRAMWVLRP